MGAAGSKGEPHDPIAKALGLFPRQRIREATNALPSLAPPSHEQCDCLPELHELRRQRTSSFGTRSRTRTFLGDPSTHVNDASAASGCLSPTSGRQSLEVVALDGAYGSYKLLQGLSMEALVGTGAYATVYKGTWQGKEVAVKVSSPMPADAALLQRALFEAQVTARCTHPNLVRTLAHTVVCCHQAQQQDLGDEIMTSGGNFLASWTMPYTSRSGHNAFSGLHGHNPLSGVHGHHTLSGLQAMGNAERDQDVARCSHASSGPAAEHSAGSNGAGSNSGSRRCMVREWDEVEGEFVTSTRMSYERAQQQAPLPAPAPPPQAPLCQQQQQQQHDLLLQQHDQQQQQHDQQQQQQAQLQAQPLMLLAGRSMPARRRSSLLLVKPTPVATIDEHCLQPDGQYEQQQRPRRSALRKRGSTGSLILLANVPAEQREAIHCSGTFSTIACNTNHTMDSSLLAPASNTASMLLGATTCTNAIVPSFSGLTTTNSSLMRTASQQKEQLQQPQQNSGCTDASSTGHFSLQHNAPNPQPAPDPRPNAQLATDSRPTRQQVSVMLVLELCDKGSLQDAIDLGWLRAGSGCKLLAVLHTALEVAAALEALHAADIVHGDLSAYNVLLSCDGVEALAGGRGFVAKVSDFGLSHSLDGAECVSVARYGITTHMAPEVLASSTVSRASDVYSFGVVLWQMLASRRPWLGLNSDAVREAVVHLKQALPPPKGIPAGLAALSSECMAWQASQRPAMTQVVQRLQQLLDGCSPPPLLQDF